MSIKKVITDSYYEKEYVSYDGKILSKKYAFNNYPYIINEVKNIEAKLKNKTYKQLKASNLTVRLKFRPFPSHNKMVETIDKKTSQLFKYLRLDNIKGKNADIIKSMVIFNYLAKTLNYNMGTVEEAINEKHIFKNVDIYKNLYDEVSKDYFNTQQKMAKTKSNKEYIRLRERLVKLQLKSNNLVNKIDNELNKQINETEVKLVYNALVYKKGICSGFSNTYQFLLSKLGLKCYTIENINKNNTSGHAFNVIEKKENKEYIIVDLTRALDKSFTPTQVLDSFGLTKKEYIKENSDKQAFSIKTHIPFKKDASYSYLNNIYSKKNYNKIFFNIKNKIYLSKEQEKAASFINNNYKLLNDQQNEL